MTRGLVPALAILALACTTAQATTPLSPKDSDQIRTFFGELSGGLMGACESKSEAREMLLGLSLVPRFFSEELNVFTSRAQEDGAPRAIDFTGFEVEATLWMGVVPVEKVALFFWLGKDEVRLFKFNRDESHTMTLFKPPSASAWRGPVGQAFGALSESLLKAAFRGECAEVPLVRPKDLSSSKTHPKAKAMIEAQAARAAKDCAELAGMPFNRITWKLGQARGVVTTRKKEKLSFELDLLAGPKRGLRVYRLTRPQSPR